MYPLGKQDQWKLIIKYVPQEVRNKEKGGSTQRICNISIAYWSVGSSPDFTLFQFQLIDNIYGKAIEIAQVLGHLPFMWEARIESVSPFTSVLMPLK